MNIAANPVIETDQTIYLKDYQKPSFCKFYRPEYSSL